jgi:hypothetical protein
MRVVAVDERAVHVEQHRAVLAHVVHPHERHGVTEIRR